MRAWDTTTGVEILDHADAVRFGWTLLFVGSPVASPVIHVVVQAFHRTKPVATFVRYTAFRTSDLRFVLDTYHVDGIVLGTGDAYHSWLATSERWLRRISEDAPCGMYIGPFPAETAMNTMPRVIYV